MCLVLCILNILKVDFKFNRSTFKELEGENHVMKNL